MVGRAGGGGGRGRGAGGGGEKCGVINGGITKNGEVIINGGGKWGDNGGIIIGTGGRILWGGEPHTNSLRSMGGVPPLKNSKS